MASSEAQDERWRRAVEYHNTEGRALRDIEHELHQIRLLLAALAKHFGARA